MEKKKELYTTNCGRYFQQFWKIFYTVNGLLSMENEVCSSYVLRLAATKLLHETDPRQFGMSFLSEYVCWPYINRMISFHGKSGLNLRQKP